MKSLPTSDEPKRPALVTSGPYIRRPRTDARAAAPAKFTPKRRDDLGNEVVHRTAIDWVKFKQSFEAWLKEPGNVNVQAAIREVLESLGIMVECGSCRAYGRKCDRMIWPFGCGHCRALNQARACTLKLDFNRLCSKGSSKCDGLHTDVAILFLGIAQRLQLKIGPYSGFEVPYNHGAIMVDYTIPDIVAEHDKLILSFEKFTHCVQPIPDGCTHGAQLPKRGLMLKFRHQFSTDGKDQEKLFAHTNH